jgi:hypothetical protein
LAFQGAGLTHKEKKSPYRHYVQKAVAWLLKHQDPTTGDLSAGAEKRMYSHALATIALCEAGAMTRDEIVRAAANKAVRFIEMAQDEVRGGWGGEPGSHDGDTWTTGWQVMALKSAQTAGVGVNSMSLEGARKWLASVAQGKNHGLYAYQPYGKVSPSMTAVGMLCQQYLGINPSDPSLLEGKQYLLANMPDASLQENIYYCYCATLVMHNFMGADWDRWNRQMRRILTSTQCKGGCAEGSWNPGKPTKESLNEPGGRLVATSLSVLTLEIYYRYPPLYKVNNTRTAGSLGSAQAGSPAGFSAGAASNGKGSRPE